jgi:hypothetical protein
MPQAKYLRDDYLGIFTWTNKGLSHKIVKERLRCENVVSAGFVGKNGDEIHCYGYSETLRTGSLPEDAEMLTRSLES